MSNKRKNCSETLLAERIVVLGERLRDNTISQMIYMQFLHYAGSRRNFFVKI